MQKHATIAPAGKLGLTVSRGGVLLDRHPDWDQEGNLRALLQHGMPHKGLPEEVNDWRSDNMRNHLRAWRVLLARGLKIPTYYGALWLSVFRGETGEVLPLGLASLRVVTTAGVNKVVSVLNTADATTGVNFKYHGFGTGTTAEAAADTALVTELTTQYATDNVRPTGSQTVGGSSNIYRTVATFSPDAGGTIAVTEHGIFSQAAVAGGTLLDRSVFSAVNTVAAADSITSTYDLTLPAGS